MDYLTRCIHTKRAKAAKIEQRIEEFKMSEDGPEQKVNTHAHTHTPLEGSPLHLSLSSPFHSECSPEAVEPEDIRAVQGLRGRFTGHELT